MRRALCIGVVALGIAGSGLAYNLVSTEPDYREIWKEFPTELKVELAKDYCATIPKKENRPLQEDEKILDLLRDYLK